MGAMRAKASSMIDGEDCCRGHGCHGICGFMEVFMRGTPPTRTGNQVGESQTARRHGSRGMSSGLST